SERAAQIQRELLPTEKPELEGYEVAAACLPAKDVSGDFYDWMGPQGGQLDLTVAEVMGEGAGSALVMATLRTALRTAPQELGPAARVALAAESLSRGLTDDDLFVTMLHARLDLASGALRYVDAGHGYCVIRRAGGELERLERQSEPLGASGAKHEEGEVRLEPGDSLLACTDGLLKPADQSVVPDDLPPGDQGSESAQEGGTPPGGVGGGRAAPGGVRGRQQPQRRHPHRHQRQRRRRFRGAVLLHRHPGPARPGHAAGLAGRAAGDRRAGR